VTARYERFASPRDVLSRAAELSARTYVVDVEPLVTSWHSGLQPLDEGVARTAGQLGAIAGARVVCFATNSARRPAAIPSSSTARVMYLASARKPLVTALYRRLPRPGVVIGDQVVTDGALARRLGFTFLHYCPEVSSMPIGPLLLRCCGWLLLPLLFPGCPWRGALWRDIRRSHGSG
jgi:predicted HAD superfamily phosphohydrolase YqeG